MYFTENPCRGERNEVDVSRPKHRQLGCHHKESCQSDSFRKSCCQWCCQNNCQSAPTTATRGAAASQPPQKGGSLRSGFLPSQHGCSCGVCQRRAATAFDGSFVGCVRRQLQPTATPADARGGVQEKVQKCCLRCSGEERSQTRG